MRGRNALTSLLILASLHAAAGADAQTRRSRRRRHRGEATATAEHRPSQPPSPAPSQPPAPSTPRPALIPVSDDRPVLAPPGSVPFNPYRAGRAEGRTYGTVPEDDILAALRNAPLQGNFRNYGNTSVNIRVDFPGPIDGSYKPSEARHEEHWRAEIAAFRLNQLLGLERVPPAVFRSVAEEDLPTGERYGVTFTDGVSRGAMIYWVPVLRPSGVGSPESLAYWSARLQARAPIAPEERSRAEEVSTLIVFDFLIANWDRWNGLNTLADGQNRLVYRDNNGGFQVPLRPMRYQRVLGWLHQTQRFSRSVVDRARGLTLESLRDAMADDCDDRGVLLHDDQLQGVLDRRDTLVRYVDGLVARFGEDEVYAFP